jgi:large subunit ribosomal protein L6
MSRVAKQPVLIPSGVQIAESDTHFTVTGPKGVLTVPRQQQTDVAIVDGSIQVSGEVAGRPFHGLQRMLLANAVTGVSQGWTRDLELHGVGMRAVLTGTSLTLSLGFSHPVVVAPLEGISFAVTKNVITVSGIDKQLVGEVAAKIRALRSPEPYKGKGVRYAGEHVRRKAGKTGKK